MRSSLVVTYTDSQFGGETGSRELHLADTGTRRGLEAIQMHQGEKQRCCVPHCFGGAVNCCPSHWGTVQNHGCLLSAARNSKQVRLHAGERVRGAYC